MPSVLAAEVFFVAASEEKSEAFQIGAKGVQAVRGVAEVGRSDATAWQGLRRASRR